jgi:protein-disulfide isomerase
MSSPRTSKQERREAARQARLDAERAQASAATRRRRLTILLGVLAAAAVVVVVAIVVSSSGGGSSANKRAAQAVKSSGTLPGQKESAAMLDGIPQQGIYLGNPKAPVHFVEFADLQCPVCREYSLHTLPVLVQDYVRTGKVRMEFRNLSFIGPDSVKLGRLASAAARQNRLWNFADLVYYNQGEENTGYATSAFVDKVTKAAGLDTAQATSFAASTASKAPLGAANTFADRYGVNSTPSFLVGKRGGGLAKVNAGPDDVDTLKSAIDGMLGKGT